MKIAGVTTFPNIGYAITASSSGRMSLPVSPANYIYSQFKHVSGVPAPEGTSGVTISRLKILDVLIEQMNQLKKQPEFNTRDLSNEQIDAMINQYEGQIKAARAASMEMPYATAPQAPSGVLFSITA